MKTKNILLLTVGVIVSLLLLPIHLSMVALAWVLSPTLPVFALKRETLPTWLSWFQTPDAPLDGDTGFLIEHKDTPKYLRRVMWLIRNPAYGFSWTVLSARVDNGSKITVKGDKRSGDNPYKKGYTFMHIDNTIYYQFRFTLPTIKGKCLKARIGWKMFGDVKWSDDTVKNSPFKYTYTFNPFKKRN